MPRRSIDWYAGDSRRKRVELYAKEYFGGNMSKALDYIFDQGIERMEERKDKVNPELLSFKRESEIKQRQMDLGRATGTEVWERYKQKLKEVDERLKEGLITREEANKLKAIHKRDYREYLDLVFKRIGIREESEKKISEKIIPKDEARDKFIRFNNFLVENYVKKGKKIPERLEKRLEKLRALLNPME